MNIPPWSISQLMCDVKSTLMLSLHLKIMKNFIDPGNITNAPAEVTSTVTGRSLLTGLWNASHYHKVVWSGTVECIGWFGQNSKSISQQDGYACLNSSSISLRDSS